MEKQTKKI